MMAAAPSLTLLVLAQAIQALVQDAASSGEAVLHINGLHSTPLTL